MRLDSLSVVEKRSIFLWHVWTNWVFFLLAGRTSSSSAACGFGWPNLPPQSRVTWLGVYRSGHPYWPSSFGSWTLPLEAACSSSLLAELLSSCSSVLTVVLRGRNKGGRG